MNRVKAFILAESMTALMITILGVSTFSLVFSQEIKIDQQMEKRTDRAVAQHILRKTHLAQVEIHDCLYRKRETDAKK